MKPETCLTCRYHVAQECRRYPPALGFVPVMVQHPISRAAVPQLQTPCAFPSTPDDLWCGEHAPLPPILSS